MEKTYKNIKLKQPTYNPPSPLLLLYIYIYITLSLLTFYIDNTLLFSFQHLSPHSQQPSPHNLNPVSNADQIEKIKFKKDVQILR